MRMTAELNWMMTNMDIKVSSGLITEGELRMHIYEELSGIARNYTGTNQLAIYEAANQVLKGQYKAVEADLSQESGCGGNCTCQ